VAFYRSVLEGCRERGIEPYVTLYHWDLPQALQDAGGWPERSTAERFASYADACFDELGDLFGNVITMNEPWCASVLGHEWGLHAPGLRDPHAAIRAMHHILLGHGLAVRRCRERRPELKIGITNILSKATPRSDDPADIEAARVLDIRNNRIVLEPCYLGTYSDELLAVYEPDGFDETVILPGDLDIISTPTDFAGVNHYHNMVASHDEGSPHRIRVEQAEPIFTTFGWSNTPDALHGILHRVARDYTSLPIYVTENGATFADYPDTSGEIRDVERIDYLRGYISGVGQAIEEGVDVRGYFAWSLLDNFEWAEGFDKRFGLVYVDYRTRERIPKLSYQWYRQLIAAWRANGAHP
jgi:beta-glucosidase